MHSEKSGFSGGKALAGAVLTGGIGLLAGTIGSKDVYLTCLKCGNRFKAGEAYIMKKGKALNDLEYQVLEKLRQGSLLQAVQAYQEQTHSPLIEAKNKVEEIARKNNVTIEKSSGCLIVILLLISFGFTASILVF